MSNTFPRRHGAITRFAPIFVFPALVWCVGCTKGLGQLDEEKDFVAVTRGALAETICGRGSLDAVERDDVICRVRPVGKSFVAATIKWVIDDGSTVKKGDKVIELDSSAHLEALRKQKEVVAKARADEKLPADSLARELELLRGLENDIANCVMTAPRDGIVVYFVPERGFGAGRTAAVEGEPVRELQKFLWIYDPKRMTIRANVQEGEINKVRFGQTAHVRVDAFPGRILMGRVDFVANIANQAELPAIKFYTVIVTIGGEQKGEFRPGMTSEVAITVAEQANCLRLPASAVVDKGKDAFCYVRIGNELHVRKIVAGVSDGKLVEIREGVSEGEVVVRDPGRLPNSLRPIGEK
jgi:multidrug efflux pump subunit AcrA (membrane-fusion protein)